MDWDVIMGGGPEHGARTGNAAPPRKCNNEPRQQHVVCFVPTSRTAAFRLCLAAGSAHSLRWRFSCCAFKYLRPIVTQQNQMDDTFAFGYDLDPNDTGDDKTPEVRLSVAYAKSQQGTLSPTAPSHALRLHVDIARAALPSPNTRCLLLSPRYDVEEQYNQSIFNPSIPSMAYYRCCL